MSLAFDSYSGSGNVGAVIAIVERDPERIRQLDQPLKDIWGSSGSAGVFDPSSDYSPYLPRVGTSLTVFDRRGMVRSFRTLTSETSTKGMQTTTRQTVLRMSPADHVREVMAALNLSKTQLAEVLGVSRPTLYDWLDGKEPNVANAQRLTALVRLLADAGVNAANSISPRFVRDTLIDGELSLLETLTEDTLDKPRVLKVLAEAKQLETDARRTRIEREERLRALGFEDPTVERRTENLALNVALREWPKD